MKRIYLFLLVMAFIPLLVLSGCAGSKFFLPDAPEGFEKPYEEAKKADTTAPSKEMFLVSERPYVRWQPGGEEISCMAGKIFRDYKGKKKPGECRLELVIYGGEREKVEDPRWFNHWLNNVQTIVEVEELNKFFENLDPNNCTWDANGNGDYHRWCKGMFHARFDLGGEKGVKREFIPGPNPNKKLVKLTLTEKAVRFDIGRWEIKDKYFPLIRKIAGEIQQTSGPIKVIGHTDNLLYREGSQMDNSTLSQKRAKAVADALVLCGIDKSRINAIGKGAREPIAGKVGKQTPAQRAQNRRVEIVHNGKTGN